jgi:hypothetical protein
MNAYMVPASALALISTTSTAALRKRLAGLRVMGKDRVATAFAEAIRAELEHRA